MTETLRLSGRDAPCPYCGKKGNSAPVVRIRYRETCLANANVEDFEGRGESCVACGIYHVNPRFPLEVFEHLYPSLSDQNATAVKRIARLPVRFLIESWNLPPGPRRLVARIAGRAFESLLMPPVPPEEFAGGSVLDIGCGDGSHLRSYKRRGCNVFGTEVLPAYATLLATHEDPIPHAIGDFTEMDWTTLAPEGGFDLIIMQSVFYRLADPLKALEAAWELLAPGGTLIRIEPYCPNPEALRFMMRFNFPQGVSFVSDVGTYRKTLARILPGATCTARVFHGRSIKHATGAELSPFAAVRDVFRRLYCQAVAKEPWFIRLDVQKPS